MIKNSQLFNVTFVLLLCFFRILHAQEETRNSRGYANCLNIPGCFIQTHDDKTGILTASNWVNGFTNKTNRAVIELGLDEDKHLYHAAAFKVCAKFDLIITDVALNTTTLTNQSLDISYNPAELSRYKDKAQLILPDVYKVKVLNISIQYGSLTANCGVLTGAYTMADVYLQAEVSTNRIYDFSLSSALAATDVSHAISTTSQQLGISWAYLRGATEYELEYAYVDDYSNLINTPVPLNQLTYDFDHDATRIVTNTNHYDIPLTYGHGYIIYRIRPIGINAQKQRMEGTWYPGSVNGNLSTAACVVAINPSFPADILSWESIKTFAESGKTGIGVSFADALGLTHQSLARLNSENKTIAQGTLYDFYQRPAINVLPAPVSGLDFNYRFGLNTFLKPSGTPPLVTFDKFVFENCSVNNLCAPSGFSINTQNSLGASNYYSPYNANKEKYQGYLPDAEGFPFTQVKYTDDGLNRVAIQTLPGKVHQLGSPYQIKFMYAKPTQVELDRLFGSEAGKAVNYFKNATVDPNGQLSVSYLDVYGRTVATGLLGKEPLNLSPLANKTGTQVLTAHLENAPDNVPDPNSRCKTYNSKFIVPYAGKEGYFYEATIASFGPACEPSACYSCVYDVEISIKDECGVQLFTPNNNVTANPLGQGYSARIGTITGNAPIACSTPTVITLVGTNLAATHSITFTHPGVYTIYKKICVSEAPVDDYSETFIRSSNNTCYVDKCTIFNSLLNQINFQGAIPMSCATCINAVNSTTNLGSTTSNTVIMNSGVVSLSNPTINATNNGAGDPSSIVVTTNYNTGSIINNGPINGGLAGSGGNTSGPLVYLPPPDPQEQSIGYEQCQIYCRSNTQCEQSARLLESDFYPETGQYAATNTASPQWVKSVFNPTNTLYPTSILSSPIIWSTSSNSYSNAVGNLDYVVINGQNVAPQNLSKADFIANFRQSWAKTLMKYHPEACKQYFYCNILGNSRVYDESMKKLAHFDIACATGCVKPVTGVTSVCGYGPVGACVATNTDPVVNLASAYSQFYNAISDFTTEIATNFNQTGKDIYTYLAMQSNTNISLPTTNCTGAYFGSDACTADMEWNLFRAIYLSKKEMLYQKLFTLFKNNPASFGYNLSYGCETVPAVATVRFPELDARIDNMFPAAPNTASTSALLNQLVTGGVSTSQSYLNTVNQFTANIVPQSTLITSQCDLTCKSYTNTWDINLTAGCPAYANPLITTPSTKVVILNALIAVCKGGCDINTNLLGASSMSPGLWIPGVNQGPITNFQQVLDSYYGNGTCSAIILDKPAPYPVVNTTIITKKSLTACKCDVILQNETDFATRLNSTTNPLPSGVSYPWQLFEHNYGFDLAEYNRLKCICASVSANNWVPGYAWNQAQVDTLYARYTTEIDARLECNTCLNCTLVTNAINNLTLPISTTYTDLYDKINKDYGNQIFVRNTLNSMFGPHNLATYLDLYRDCGTYTSSTTFSNNLTQYATDLFRYLNAMVKTKTLTQNNRTMTLCTDDKFFLSALYSGTLPVIPSYNYACTGASGSNITININSSTSTIATLTLGLGAYSGGWNSLKYLENFVAYCPAPQSAGAVYQFKVDAVTSSGNITLTGAITNNVYPLAYLSSGSYVLNSTTYNYLTPALCPAPKTPTQLPAVVNLIKNAIDQANYQYEQQLAALKTQFENQYRDHCFNTLGETFVRNYNGANEYNFTLYYYDVAGNLQRTVPPKGADPGILNITTNLPANSTQLPAYANPNAVAINFVNEYHYNSYNQPYEENSVDGGLTQYYYDEVGRLLASQNAQQLANSTSTYKVFSYTLYDAFGRISETGEVKLPASGTQPGNAAFTQAVVMAVNTRSQVTHIYYDRPCTTASVLSAFSGGNQLNLRNRVAYVTYIDDFANMPLYDHATFYSYDDHGNVKELVQHNRTLDVFNKGFSNVQYTYELISGNMLKAVYQAGQPDQFIHKYYYDDDNRLHEVFTSSDEINWDRDAKYFYYEHGPLARVERADKKVQGTDYLYTIQGWIKGLNSDALNPNSDGGKDATGGNAYLASFNNVHNWLAKDAMAYSLNYYDVAAGKDYTPIKSFGSADLNPLMPISNLNAAPFYLNGNYTAGADAPPLFNGNISSMNTVFIDKDITNTQPNNKPFPQLSAYTYDQLQRITSMKTFRNYSPATLTWNNATSANTDDAYRMSFSYDNNGNLLSLLRNGPGGGIVANASLSMDNLSYSYYNTGVNGLSYNSNKLRCVNDIVNPGNYPEDVDDFACEAATQVQIGNSVRLGYRRYDYDLIGNLTGDNAEYIANIEWTVDRKVRKITRDQNALVAAGITKPDMEYQYNSQRQRVVKIVKPRSSAATGAQLTPYTSWLYTYYVYDAGGNVLATYDRSINLFPGQTNYFKDKLSLGATHIYGSQRLALAMPGSSLCSWKQYLGTPDGIVIDPEEGGSSWAARGSSPSQAVYTANRQLGFKDFELTNHLGNVITTVSDRKLQDGYTLTNCVKNYDFSNGVPPSADINNNNISLSVVGGSLLCTMNNNYATSGINPKFGANLTAGMTYQIEFDFDPGNLTLNDQLYAVPFDYNGSFALGNYFFTAGAVPPAGHYSFAYTPAFTGPSWASYLAFNTNGTSNHWFKVDNVKMCSAATAVSPGVVNSYSPDVLSNTDYYPFGQEMPGRKWRGTADRYRYGYQNQEQDEEFWSGAVSYEYRIEDPRIGRFFSVDPLYRSYPWNSPYAFSENRVTNAIELEGLEAVDINVPVDGGVENGAIGQDAMGNQYQCANGEWVKSNIPGVNGSAELPEVEIPGERIAAPSSPGGGAGSTPTPNKSTNVQDGEISSVTKFLESLFRENANYGGGTGKCLYDDNKTGQMGDNVSPWLALVNTQKGSFRFYTSPFNTKGVGLDKMQDDKNSSPTKENDIKDDTHFMDHAKIKSDQKPAIGIGNSGDVKQKIDSIETWRYETDEKGQVYDVRMKAKNYEEHMQGIHGPVISKSRIK